MKLYTLCNSCDTEIKINSGANTRPELAHKMGEKFQVNCPDCGINNERHPNDIRAKVDPNIILIGIGIGAVASFVLIFYFGFIALATFLIPLLIYQGQENSATAFNKYMLPRL